MMKTCHQNTWNPLSAVQVGAQVAGRLLRALILVLLSSLSLPGQATSSTNHALWVAFLDLRIVATDGDIVEGDVAWRISFGANDLDALGNKSVVASGIADPKGVVRLSGRERRALYEAWLRTPGQLWFIYKSHCLQLESRVVDGKTRIALVQPRFSSLQKTGEATTNYDDENTTLLNPAAYTQAGFVAKPFVVEFEDWRTRFTEDLNELRGRMKNDPDYGHALLTPEGADGLRSVFNRSIDDGHKGLSLRRMLVGAFYSGDRRVWPPGTVFIQLVLSKSAQPVGFGGAFDDNGKAVELWYMVFDDLAKWTVRDFKESVVFRAFKPVELPAYQTMERNRWPALVFVRGADGKVQLYALSMEMGSIIRSVFNAQIN